MLPQSIIHTVAYAHIFQQPLKVGELYAKLIASTSYSHTDTLNSLQILVAQNRLGESFNQNRLGESEKYIFFPSSSKHIKTRIKRETISREKIKKTRRVGKWLQKIPFVQAVYLTGALAVNNAKSSDDIDLMIVTQPNRLWLTRLIVTMFLDLLGVRRRPRHFRVANKFCLNLYLASNRLSLSSAFRNLYTAHEVVQAKPVWSKPGVHSNFLHVNSWITSLLPHSPLPYSASRPKAFSLTKSRPGPELVFKWLEILLFWAQKQYMSNKQTQERVSLNSAFFHPRNTGQIILHQYHYLISNHHQSKTTP